MPRVSPAFFIKKAGKETSRLGFSFFRWVLPLPRTGGFFLTCKDLSFFKKKGNKETSRLGFAFSRWFLPLPQTVFAFSKQKGMRKIFRLAGSISPCQNICAFSRTSEIFLSAFLKTEGTAGLCRAYSSKIFRDRPSRRQPVSIPHPAGESIKSSIASGKNQHIDTQEMPAASAACSLFRSLSQGFSGLLRGSIDLHIRSRILYA